MARGIHGPFFHCFDLTCCLRVCDISGASIHRLGIFVMACTTIMNWMRELIDEIALVVQLNWNFPNIKLAAFFFSLCVGRYINLPFAISPNLLMHPFNQ